MVGEKSRSEQANYTLLTKKLIEYSFRGRINHTLANRNLVSMYQSMVRANRLPKLIIQSTLNLLKPIRHCTLNSVLSDH